MAKIAIVTDSNSGITQAEAEKLGIYVLPMPFMIGGETFFEGVNLTQEEFYRIYALNDMAELKRFHTQLDMIAEGYRAQSVSEDL